MKKMTPPMGEVVRNLPASFTRTDLTLSALQIQHLAARYAIPVETAAIMAGLVFMEARHG
ncbi:MAG: hypothetical protein KGJ57_04980 [Sphingomonadales bacterium]|nr:hypothetical protein [Sphingomonadales bacterium]MDE2168770.1 hypothetical protein [Sphingomonadales bacterium]